MDYNPWSEKDWSIKSNKTAFSLCNQVLRCVRELGGRCCIFPFKILPIFSRWRGRRKASPVLVLYSSSVGPLCCAQNGILQNLTEWCIGGLRCAKSLNVLSCINGAITYVKMTFAKGTDITPQHHKPRLLDLVLITVWKDLFFFWSTHHPFLQRRSGILIGLNPVHV